MLIDCTYKWLNDHCPNKLPKSCVINMFTCDQCHARKPLAPFGVILQFEDIINIMLFIFIFSHHSFTSLIIDVIKRKLPGEIYIKNKIFLWCDLNVTTVQCFSLHLSFYVSCVETMFYILVNFKFLFVCLFVFLVCKTKSSFFCVLVVCNLFFVFL